MTDVPPTPPPSGSAPTPVSTQSTAPAAATPGTPPAPPSSPARATALPPELARAPTCTTIDGEVRAASGDGRVTVRTDQGEVRLELGRAQVAQLLRPGTPVTIEIRNTTVQPPLVMVTGKGAATGTTGP